MFIRDQTQRRPPNDPPREDEPPALPPLRDAPVLTRVGDPLLCDWPKLELRLDVPTLAFGALKVLRDGDTALTLDVP